MHTQTQRTNAQTYTETRDTQTDTQTDTETRDAQTDTETKDTELRLCVFRGET